MTRYACVLQMEIHKTILLSIKVESEEGGKALYG